MTTCVMSAVGLVSAAERAAEGLPQYQAAQPTAARPPPLSFDPPPPGRAQPPLGAAVLALLKPDRVSENCPSTNGVDCLFICRFMHRSQKLDRFIVFRVRLLWGPPRTSFHPPVRCRGGPALLCGAGPVGATLSAGRRGLATRG